MSNQYQLCDGSPRYGHRAETPAPHQGPPARVEEAVEGAARLGLDAMAAAINRRLTSAWADKTNPLVAALREDYPEELAAARELALLHLARSGSGG